MGDHLTPYRKLLESARKDKIESIKERPLVGPKQTQILPFELPFKEAKHVLACPVDIVIERVFLIGDEENELTITVVLSDKTIITKTIVVKPGSMQLNIEVDAESILSMRWNGEKSVFGSLVLRFKG